MFELIKILLFSNMALLTPEPIDLRAGEMVTIEKSISAITGGAAIYVDISSMVPSQIQKIVETRRWVDSKFQDGFARAVLFDERSDEKLILEYKGFSSGGEGKLSLIFSSEEGVPIDRDYKKIQFKTEVELREILIYWKNYQK